MIIQCESCSRKFTVEDSDIPKEGRTVQCGYCSVTWHQVPVSISTKTIKKLKRYIYLLSDPTTGDIFYVGKVFKVHLFNFILH